MSFLKSFKIGSKGVQRKPHLENLSAEIGQKQGQKKL